MVTPDFRDVLNRTIKLYLREIKDGCLDCRKKSNFGGCPKHKPVVWDIVEGRTRKYFKIDNNLKVTYLIQPGDTE